MKTFLGLVSVVILLAGCGTTVNREVSACQEFFAVQEFDGVDPQRHLTDVFRVEEDYQGTSIGRAAGEYARNFEFWVEDLAEWSTTGRNDDYDQRRTRNLSIYGGAITLKNNLIARCDDLLTGR